jgi:hypothetical protein
MTSEPAPDYSVCGTPLVELLGHHQLDEHVEAAAKLAIDNPRTGIAVCLFPGEDLIAEFNTWLRHQRELLAAWRTQRSERGVLKLRTRRIVKPSENVATAAYVVFHAAKPRKVEP